MPPFYPSPSSPDGDSDSLSTSDSKSSACPQMPTAPHPTASASSSSASSSSSSSSIVLLLPCPSSTSRLTFRCWSLADEDISNAIRLFTDERVMTFVGGQFTHQQVMTRIDTEIRHATLHGVQYWMLHDKCDGAFVGCCGLKPRVKNEPTQWEFGFYLVPDAQGKGLASEAARSVFAHAFAPRDSGGLGASALFAGHHPKNSASRRTLLKLGFAPAQEEFYPPTGLMHPSYLLTAPTVAIQSRLPSPTTRLDFMCWGPSPTDIALANRLYKDERVMALVGGTFNDAQVAARLESEMTNEAQLGISYWRLHRRDADGEFVGVCGLKPRMVPVPDCYEFGFYFIPEAQGQGLATEAGKAVIAHAMASRESGGLGARQLFAKHHPKNGASGGALIKLGFTPDGEEFYEPTGLMHPAYQFPPKAPQTDTISHCPAAHDSSTRS